MFKLSYNFINNTKRKLKLINTTDFVFFKGYKRKYKCLNI